LDRLVGLIESAQPSCGAVTVVAIDGGAASGKTSLAMALTEQLPGSAVLSTDLLLAGWAGQFSFWHRLREGVLAPLAAGRPGSYRRYDWQLMRFAETVAVPVPGVLLVEGVSAIPGCADQASVAIFLDVPREVRQQRWIERDGPVQPAWLDWLDNEDRFFATHPAPPGTVLLGGSGVRPPGG
jgi:hypothetical protein